MERAGCVDRPRVLDRQGTHGGGGALDRRDIAGEQGLARLLRQACRRTVRQSGQACDTEADLGGVIEQSERLLEIGALLGTGAAGGG